MFYTSGQYVCPLIVDSGKAVERALSTDERAKLGILLISMDPARDDPEALMSVASKRKLDGARWSLASPAPDNVRSEEHTSELQSLMRISYAVFCLKKKIEDEHNMT